MGPLMSRSTGWDPALEAAASSHLVAHEDYLSAAEAVLLVAEEPVTPAELAAALNVAEHQALTLLDELRAEADGEAGGRQRGFQLREVAGGWRYYSRLRYAEEVSAFVLAGQTTRLSSAALETLAVIAYRQPVSRSQVAAIRGVNVDGVVRTLVTRRAAGTPPARPGDRSDSLHHHRRAPGAPGAGQHHGPAQALTAPARVEEPGAAGLGSQPALTPARLIPVRAQTGSGPTFGRSS